MFYAICGTDLTHTSYIAHGTETSPPAVALKNRAWFPAIRTLYSSNSESSSRSQVGSATTTVRRDKDWYGDNTCASVTPKHYVSCNDDAYPAISVGRALIFRITKDLLIACRHEENQLDYGIIEFERRQCVNENVVALFCTCAGHSIEGCSAYHIQLTVRTTERRACVPIHCIGQGMLLIMQNCILSNQPSAFFLVPEQVYRGNAVGDVIGEQFDVAFQQVRCTEGSCAVYVVMCRIGNMIVPLHKTQTSNLSVTRCCSIKRVCPDFVQIATCVFLLPVADQMFHLRDKRTMCNRFRSFPSWPTVNGWPPPSSIP